MDGIKSDGIRVKVKRRFAIRRWRDHGIRKMKARRMPCGEDDLLISWLKMRHRVKGTRYRRKRNRIGRDQKVGVLRGMKSSADTCMNGQHPGASKD